MSIINLKCYLKDGQDFIISPCKKDKVTILEFAIKTLLANQGYQALSFNFGLYVNDLIENKLMESAEEISKYFNKPLVQDQIHILIKLKELLFILCNGNVIHKYYFLCISYSGNIFYFLN